MITAGQAKKLRELIADYAEAYCDMQMAGTYPPADAEQIRAESREIKARLDAHIAKLTGPK